MILRGSLRFLINRNTIVSRLKLSKEKYTMINIQDKDKNNAIAGGWTIHNSICIMLNELVPFPNIPSNWLYDPSMSHWIVFNSKIMMACVLSVIYNVVHVILFLIYHSLVKHRQICSKLDRQERWSSLSWWSWIYSNSVFVNLNILLPSSILYVTFLWHLLFVSVKFV